MDTIERIHGSVIQHGPHNNRIYLMQLDMEKSHLLLPFLERLAGEKGYTKIFARIPAFSWSVFAEAGYIKEGVVPGFFQGNVDGIFSARYLSERRRKDQMDPELLGLIRGSKRPLASAGKKDISLPPNVEVVQCAPADTSTMSSIYRNIFATYPFPVDQPQYLEKNMGANVLYFSIRVNGEIAALASAELDPDNSNAEMTDFATRKQWRGRGFARELLRHMHEQARQRGVKTAYTIARARSYGMNRVFQREGYTYGGFFPNNTQIAGSIESMTLWYKHLGNDS
ncbi:MAG: putative beta-lysine N-acetyltransferase [Desulfopila sp.]|nr:putative beta-lysine N-acetyltransferase [Desulfopila sp.]